MAHAAAWRPNDVRQEAVAGFPAISRVVDVALQQLHVQLDLPIPPQVVGIQTMHHRLAQRMIQDGADVAQRAAAVANGFQQPTQHAKIPTVAVQQHVLPVPRPTQHRVVLQRRQHPVAERTALSSELGRAQELRGARFLVARHLHVVGNGQQRLAADAAGVQQRGGRPRESLLGASGADGGTRATGVGAAGALHRGTRRGEENLVALHEEEPLLREKRFPRSEVDDHVVGFH